MFHVFCLMVSKLIIVSKNNLRAFFLPPLILKFKKTINEKAKIQTPHLATIPMKQANVAISVFCRAVIMDTFTY